MDDNELLAWADEVVMTSLYDEECGGGQHTWHALIMRTRTDTDWPAPRVRAIIYHKSAHGASIDTYCTNSDGDCEADAAERAAMRDWHAWCREDRLCGVCGTRYGTWRDHAEEYAVCSRCWRKVKA